MKGSIHYDVSPFLTPEQPLNNTEEENTSANTPLAETITMSLLSLSIVLLSTISSLMFVAIALQDTLSRGQVLRWNETLSSSERTFALGFFQPGESNYRYLGIWYDNIPNKTVVWVANRERPITDIEAYLTILDSGNLALIDSTSTIFWSSGIPAFLNNTKAKLLDSGNLVLQQSNTHIIWQSFDNPMDTFLPGMTLRYSEWAAGKKKLIAWKNEDDPSTGDFSLTLWSLQIMIFNKSRIFWSSGPLLGSYAILPLLNPGSGEIPVFMQVTGQGENTIANFSVPGGSLLVRLRLDHFGRMSLFVWEKQQNYWKSVVSKPSQFCDYYGVCGPWGACDKETCICLKGFKPIDKTNSFEGCVREVPLGFSRDDSFLSVENTNLPDGFNMLEHRTEGECRTECLYRNKCTAYAYSNSTTVREGYYCLVWEGDVTGLTGPNTRWGNISIRLDASALVDREKKQREFLLPLLLSLGGVIFVAFLIFFVKRIGLHGKITSCMGLAPKGKEDPVGGEITGVKAVMLEDVDFSCTNFADSGLFDAPLVDFMSVKRATNNFSDAYKIGSGGFGSVYKGKLTNGYEVAVKRLSKASMQGQREFANEVRLIAKLQHKNLVRLIGWSTDKDEKILIYEYMPNKSLDRHIFGKSVKLSWDMRFSIIEGIADGLLYLHHHSRMRVVHRDLKTSNILLDSEMAPKISDFGLARIIESNQTQGNTRKIAGTFGYMSPEYALDGIFSEKSDVFSFGVILLEVITGKRNMGYYSCRETPSVIGYVWQLWKQGRTVELLRPPTKDSACREKALRCIQIGLLCTEESAGDRPAMNSVVSMLTSESDSLPVPKQPGFSFVGKNYSGVRSSTSSVNCLTEITMEAR